MNATALRVHEAASSAVARLAATHRGRLEPLLFASGDDSGRIPHWLAGEIAALRQRYGNVRTTQRFDALIASLARADERPFEVFVVGEGKFGKSTLLNALLGAELSAVHFLPATRTFLRFVPSQSPSATARLFVRALRPMHDWLLARLPAGKPIEDLLETNLHLVSCALADDLLAAEAEHCRDPNSRYETAIVELERETAISDRSTFPHHVRLVDTQGLNQLFPEELEARAASGSTRSTTEAFEQWMHENPRGKHLDWQLRRCDALLWVAHARKSSSAVTLAALRHFRKYGKRTILAVTNIDRVADGASGRATALDEIERCYGACVDRIVPVNGKEAMAGVLSRDPKRVADSGLLQLKQAMFEVAVHEAAAVRARGLYNAASVTERQLRGALQEYCAAIARVVARLATDRARLECLRQQARTTVAQAISEAADDQWGVLEGRSGFLTLDDDGASVVRRLDATELGRAVVEAGKLSLNGEIHTLRALCDELARKPYTLPGFDAEGRPLEEAVSARFGFSPGRGDLPNLQLLVRLDTAGWTALLLDVQELVGTLGAVIGLEALAEDAKQRRYELRERRRADVLGQVRRQWDPFVHRLREHIVREIDDAVRRACAALDKLEIELAAFERRPLAQTAERVDDALAQRPIRPVLPGRVMDAVRGRAMGPPVRNGQALRGRSR